jgi:hypothetical protein
VRKAKEKIMNNSKKTIGNNCKRSTNPLFKTRTSASSIVLLLDYNLQGLNLNKLRFHELDAKGPLIKRREINKEYSKSEDVSFLVVKCCCRFDWELCNQKAKLFALNFQFVKSIFYFLTLLHFNESLLICSCSFKIEANLSFLNYFDSLKIFFQPNKF